MRSRRFLWLSAAAAPLPALTEALILAALVAGEPTSPCHETALLWDCKTHRRAPQAGLSEDPRTDNFQHPAISSNPRPLALPFSPVFSSQVWCVTVP